MSGQQMYLLLNQEAVENLSVHSQTADLWVGILPEPPLSRCH